MEGGEGRRTEGVKNTIRVGEQRPGRTHEIKTKEKKIQTKRKKTENKEQTVQ